MTVRTGVVDPAVQSFVVPAWRGQCRRVQLDCSHQPTLVTAHLAQTFVCDCKTQTMTVPLSLTL